MGRLILAGALGLAAGAHGQTAPTSEGTLRPPLTNVPGRAPASSTAPPASSAPPASDAPPASSAPPASNTPPSRTFPYGAGPAPNTPSGQLQGPVPGRGNPTTPGPQPNQPTQPGPTPRQTTPQTPTPQTPTPQIPTPQTPTPQTPTPQVPRPRPQPWPPRFWPQRFLFPPPRRYPPPSLTPPAPFPPPHRYPPPARRPLRTPPDPTLDGAVPLKIDWPAARRAAADPGNEPRLEGARGFIEANRADIDNLFLPLALPGDPGLLRDAALYAHGDFYTLSYADHGVSVALMGYARAFPLSQGAEARLPPGGLAALRPEDGVEIEADEEGLEADFQRFGAVYGVLMVCDDPADTRCRNEDYVRTLILSLTVVLPTAEERDAP
jgi:hypothetical protein